MPRHLERTKRPAGGAIDVGELKRKSWPGFAAEHIRIDAPVEYDFRVSRPANHVCLMNLYRTDGETTAPGLPRVHAKDLRNKLTYAPLDCELEGWCKLEKPAVVTTVSIEPVSGDEANIDLSRLPPRIEFEDQMLRWVMLRFQALLTDPSYDVPGYAETLAEVLSFDLYRIASGAPRRSPECSGLSANQVRLVTEYMESHLNEKTTISELAGLVDLTRFHFIRSFKQAAGIPPHQFMIRLRVDRAKEMLAEGGRSVAEVASRTGFGSSIQLTRAFRRVLGTTPSAFRRDML
jgi:AraC family transcriptional regulator